MRGVYPYPHYEPPTEEQMRRGKVRDMWIESKVPNRHAACIDLKIYGLKEQNSHQKWGENWAKVGPTLGSGVIVCLLGKRGTGKTQMAVFAIMQSCVTLKSARYTTAMEFYVKLRGAYRKDSRESESTILDGFVSPSLLVIDEVQERGETGWEDRMLTYLVDQRYQRMKDTILISNQAVDKFAEAVGSSITDRTKEGGGVLVFDWDSFRGKKQ